MPKHPADGSASFDTLTATVPVSGMLPNDWRSWPSEMQDRLAWHVEMTNVQRRKQDEGPLVIAETSCHRDEHGGFYVRIVLQPAHLVEAWKGPAPRILN